MRRTLYDSSVRREGGATIPYLVIYEQNRCFIRFHIYTNRSEHQEWPWNSKFSLSSNRSFFVIFMPKSLSSPFLLDLLVLTQIENWTQLKIVGCFFWSGCSFTIIVTDKPSWNIHEVFWKDIFHKSKVRKFRIAVSNILFINSPVTNHELDSWFSLW